MSGDDRIRRALGPISDPGIPTRKAPPDMRLPVPRYIRLSSAALGIATAVMGIGYATIQVYRRPALEAQSVVAVIEEPLGWAMFAAGLWVLAAALIGHGRASAHGVAAACHAAFLGAIAATYVIAYPLQPIQGVALALFGFIAHGGASLDYWQRGWR
jgi:hypothetical protein